MKTQSEFAIVKMSCLLLIIFMVIIGGCRSKKSTDSTGTEMSENEVIKGEAILDLSVIDR